MDGMTVTNLGGWCQLAGVVLVVWDLLGLARYRADLARTAARVHGWWTAKAAAVRRRFGRPRQPSIVYGQTSSGMRIDVRATGWVRPVPYTTRPGRSVEDRLAVLAGYVNRLRDEVLKEQEERAKAISEERQARRDELQAETERLEHLIAVARQEIHDLREAITGGVRLRWEGIPLLVIGVVFTTWPENIAHWLGWLPWRPLVLLVVLYALARLFGVFQALAAKL